MQNINADGGNKYTYLIGWKLSKHDKVRKRILWIVYFGSFFLKNCANPSNYCFMIHENSI